VKRTEWDRHADEFEDLVCDIAREESSRQLGRFVAAVRPSPRASVLVDLGCGVGSFILKYGDRFQRIVAVDFAPRIVARAQERCAGMPNIAWLAMDMARAAEVVGAKADLTVSLNVITSPSKAKRNALWSSVPAVTKPRGHVLIVVPSIESYKMVEEVEHGLGKYLQPPARPDGVASRAEAWQKHYAREELIETMSQQGLQIKRIGRALYPWSREGLRKPRSHGAKRPWDWICLGQRT
jgi:SAM-dependent methyltransferase